MTNAKLNHSVIPAPFSHPNAGQALCQSYQLTERSELNVMPTHAGMIPSFTNVLERSEHTVTPAPFSHPDAGQDLCQSYQLIERSEHTLIPAPFSHPDAGQDLCQSYQLTERSEHTLIPAPFSHPDAGQDLCQSYQLTERSELNVVPAHAGMTPSFTNVTERSEHIVIPAQVGISAPSTHFQSAARISPSAQMSYTNSNTSFGGRLRGRLTQKTPTLIPLTSTSSMKLKLLLTLLFTHFTFLIASAQFGQQQLWQTLQMRLGESFIRVAEPGQLVDTVHVWGDITVPGNYIVPKGSSVTDIISYARGPARTVANVVQLDWSQLRMDVVLSHYNPETQQDEKSFFQYKYNQALVTGIRTKIAQNRDVIVVEVKRKPVLVDWLGVIGPVISAVSGVVSLYVILSTL